jgi:YgiT-type zinc finger domain-containing protein
VKKKPATCPVCGGTIRPGTTTFTADVGSGLVVIRKVPALVCTQCGVDWIDDRVAARIERVVAEAKAKRSQVEVIALP